jgi:hypothetical protein
VLSKGKKRVSAFSALLEPVAGGGPKFAGIIPFCWQNSQTPDLWLLCGSRPNQFRKVDPFPISKQKQKLFAKNSKTHFFNTIFVHRKQLLAGISMNSVVCFGIQIVLEKRRKALVVSLKLLTFKQCRLKTDLFGLVALWKNARQRTLTTHQPETSAFYLVESSFMLTKITPVIATTEKIPEINDRKTASKKSVKKQRIFVIACQNFLRLLGWRGHG